MNDTTQGGDLMRQFLVGAAVVVTIIYWIGSIGDERAAVDETRLSSGTVAREQKSSADGRTQVSTATFQQDQFSVLSDRADMEKVVATVFVRGKRVALREGPGKKFSILDRYDASRSVRLLSVDGEWSRVQEPHAAGGLDRIASPKYR
ncbi:hypothetical protein QN224_31810 [Sinorhizobium sp. 8-89]|uniref:hypothetical protein n=1 Tax=Sinorhizobium sp. 7-81 TaxID=3049087 RepID=UPI0024C383E2|nr:hypothetical protein [Sinorhizobium sp. 7-81]MDK1389917.1 hypothetical protein [Sinorhizobium sp. 7-81]